MRSPAYNSIAMGSISFEEDPMRKIQLRPKQNEKIGLI